MRSDLKRKKKEEQILVEDKVKRFKVFSTAHCTLIRMRNEKMMTVVIFSHNDSLTITITGTSWFTRKQSKARFDSHPVFGTSVVFRSLLAMVKMLNK